ncbi:hypothetical protein Y1Q_0005346 [Alligator mississippiensis]|uniref:Uncharacterized protein n=1 Tax=Alligator mississippiensis TaxID=8496 RepID=A0A151MVT4_ALLMI|nr:hypothetical protein Y1Q_0005346 [Alligator mississippiensis]
MMMCGCRPMPNANKHPRVDAVMLVTTGLLLTDHCHRVLGTAIVFLTQAQISITLQRRHLVSGWEFTHLRAEPRLPSRQAKYRPIVTPCELPMRWPEEVKSPPAYKKYHWASQATSDRLGFNYMVPSHQTWQASYDPRTLF